MSQAVKPYQSSADPRRGVTRGRPLPAGTTGSPAMRLEPPAVPFAGRYRKVSRQSPSNGVTELNAMAETSRPFWPLYSNPVVSPVKTLS